MNLYTIGHSNHPIDRFLQLLSQYDITTLVDVRSTPYSRFHPQFNKAAVQTVLVENGFEYVYMGDTLGGRPQDPSCYMHGTIPRQSKDYLHEISYPAVMQRPWFIQGTLQLLEKASLQTTCILCSEGDPLQCHRHHLIAKYYLANQPGLTILHILRDRTLIDAGTLPDLSDNATSQQLSF